MSDKNDKKLVAKPTMKIVKKQIEIPSQPGDVVKDGLTALAPISVFKVKDSVEIDFSNRLITAAIAKYPELTELLNWPTEKMAKAFDEFYTTRNLSYVMRNEKSAGMDFFREVINHLNTADDYGSSWQDTDNNIAFTMNLRAIAKIHKTTPVADRYTANADISELREGIEDHRVVNMAIAQYAAISESFRTNMRDVGYIPLNNTKSFTSETFKTLSNRYTEKTILATYANLPFLIKKCTGARNNNFPVNIESTFTGGELHQAEQIASELGGSWKNYSLDTKPADVRDLPHFKLAYELQRAISKDSKLQDSLVENVISQFLRAGDGLEAAGLVMNIDQPLVGYTYPSSVGWGITSDFERMIPKIGKPMYALQLATQQVRGKAMSDPDIPQDALISEIVNYFKYVQALYRSLFTNHNTNKRGGFYYARFHDSHYSGASTRTKESPKIVIGSKRASANSLLQAISDDVSRIFGRDYIAQPNAAEPYLLEWSSFLVHASRFVEGERNGLVDDRTAGLGVHCGIFRAAIESIRVTMNTFNNLINELIIERSFRPYAMLSAASELHEKIKAACGSIYSANNSVIVQLSLGGYLATDWSADSIGYSSTVARLGGTDPDPVDRFNPNLHLVGAPFDQPDSSFHKSEDLKKKNRMIELFKSKDQVAEVEEVKDVKEDPKPESAPVDKPEDKAAE